MDDRFLSEMRRDPRPEFARDLRARLAREGEPDAPRSRLVPALAFAGAAVAIAVAFTFPTVRASAQAFLDLFRVRNFAAVPVDAERMRQLDGKLDVKALLSDRIETLKEPGDPRPMPSVEAAGREAGIEVRVPQTIPDGLALDRVDLVGDGAARLTIDTARLRQALDALDIRDVAIPDGIDGRTVTVRTASAVVQRFRKGDLRADLLEARSPEVELPPGADLERLGEIGLRIVGLDRAEAHRFAHSIDWTGTVLVPVPVQGGAFREVTVRGNRALLVTIAPGSGDNRPRRRSGGTTLLWAEGGQVFALTGNLGGMSMVEMANSIR